MTEVTGRLSQRFEAARAARIAAVQALFQIESTGTSNTSVTKEFQEHRLASDDYPYAPNGALFNRLMEHADTYYTDLQTIVAQNLPEEWTLETLDPVLRAALLLASAELLYTLTPLPAPVIISEYIDIARGFCGIKEAGFANRILDQIANVLNLPLHS